MPLLIVVALHEVLPVMILYCIVVPDSLSDAETVRLSLVPPMVVAIVGIVVSMPAIALEPTYAVVLPALVNFKHR